MRLDHAPVSLIPPGIALVCMVWFTIVFVVQCIGIYKLFRYYSSPPPKPISPSLPKDEVPHITAIRPVKGWEAAWYDCLASTFRQTYPRDKLTVYLCVESTDDPAFPHLQRLVKEFPDSDAKIMVEEQDPVLHGPGGKIDNLGPNPKIRNISRAYREAKGDVIWVVDANVWVSKGVAGRMVDKLCGYRPNGARTKPFKFVHQLPLVVDTTHASSDDAQDTTAPNDATRRSPSHDSSSVLSYGGGLLEEMFMSTTHAKFYSSINTVGIAPCIVGKSNMFRKSHLDRLTDPAQNPILTASDASRGRGIDFFSSYICEDHLIGDLLWRSKLPGFANHGLVSGDLAIQPTAAMSVSDYVARRVRWLRVRKWTVIAATLVEPGIEPFLCCAYLAHAATSLPALSRALAVPPTAAAGALVWATAVFAWMLVDRWVSSKLRRCEAVEADRHTPAFARGGNGGPRPFLPWLCAWLGREALALPIWTWAVLLGTTVSWRGRRFAVRMDMGVVEISPPDGGRRLRRAAAGEANGAVVGVGRRKDKDHAD